MRSQEYIGNERHQRVSDHDEYEASLEESPSHGTAITSDTNGRSFQYNVEEDGRGGYYYTTVADGNLSEIKRSAYIKNYNHDFETDSNDREAHIGASSSDYDIQQRHLHHHFISDERNNHYNRYEYEDSISYKSHGSHNYVSQHGGMIDEASGQMYDMEDEQFKQYQSPQHRHKNSNYIDANKSEYIRNHHSLSPGYDYEDSERNSIGRQVYDQSNLDSYDNGGIGNITKYVLSEKPYKSRNNTLNIETYGSHTNHARKYVSDSSRSARSSITRPPKINRETDANLLPTSYRSGEKKSRKANFDRLPKHEKQKYIQKNFGSNLQYISSDGKKTIENSTRNKTKNENVNTFYSSNFADIILPPQRQHTQTKEPISLPGISDEIILNGNPQIINNDSPKNNLTSYEQELYAFNTKVKDSAAIRHSPSRAMVPQTHYEAYTLPSDVTKFSELNSLHEATHRNVLVSPQRGRDVDSTHIEKDISTSHASYQKSAASVHSADLVSENNDLPKIRSNATYDDSEVLSYPRSINQLENEVSLTRTPSREEYQIKKHKRKNRSLLYLLMVIALIILSLMLTYFLWYVPSSSDDDSQGIEAQDQKNSNLNFEADDSLSLLDKLADSERNDDNVGRFDDFLASNNIDDEKNIVFGSDDFFDDDFSSPIREHRPSNSPSNKPSFVASISPSMSTSKPSRIPSTLPSIFPSSAPSQIPTMSTNKPSLLPSGLSSTSPTFFPTLHPTAYPSLLPTTRPTNYPIVSPSQEPSYTPSASPTGIPQWKIIAPLLHTKSNLNNNYGYSTSLSSSGNRLAVLHRNGVAIYDIIATSSGMQWSQLGDDIPPVWLLFDAGLTWDEVRSNAMLVSSSITLSSDGTEVTWNIALADLGRVAIFKFQNGVWTVRGQVGGYEKTPGGAYYGPSVAYAKENKSRVLVGGWNGENVRVYENNGSTWTNIGNPIEGFSPSMIQSLFGNSEGPLFGASVAISSDGLTVAVAAPHDGTKERGSVKVYKLNSISQVWEQKGQTLKGTLNSNFGILSMSGNGKRLAVGIPTMGMVQIYEYSNSVLDWLLISAKTSDFSSEKFGQMIALSEDGSSLAVIAPMTGRICVFKNISNAWLLESKCIVLGSVEDEYLLFSVSLSANGERLVVGHPGIGVMVFTRSPTQN